MVEIKTAIKKLNENNSHAWDFCLGPYLHFKSVNEVLEIPCQEELEIAEWNPKVSKTMNIIIQSLSYEILIHVKRNETAAKKLKALENLCAENETQDQSPLLQELFATELSKGDNDNVLLTKILYILDKLATSDHVLNDYIKRGLFLSSLSSSMVLS